jgi:hypothetical protein
MQLLLNRYLLQAQGQWEGIEAPDMDGSYHYEDDAALALILMREGRHGLSAGGAHDGAGVRMKASYQAEPFIKTQGTYIRRELTCYDRFYLRLKLFIPRVIRSYYRELIPPPQSDPLNVPQKLGVDLYEYIFAAQIVR